MNTTLTTKKTLPTHQGWIWLPHYVGLPMDARPEVPDAPLPEGFIWGKSGERWVPVMDLAAC